MGFVLVEAEYIANYAGVFSCTFSQSWEYSAFLTCVHLSEGSSFLNLRWLVDSLIVQLGSQ